MENLKKVNILHFAHPFQQFTKFGTFLFFKMNCIVRQIGPTFIFYQTDRFRDRRRGPMSPLSLDRKICS